MQAMSCYLGSLNSSTGSGTQTYTTLLSSGLSTTLVGGVGPAVSAVVIPDGIYRLSYKINVSSLPSGSQMTAQIFAATGTGAANALTDSLSLESNYMPTAAAVGLPVITVSLAARATTLTSFSYLKAATNNVGTTLTLVLTNSSGTCSINGGAIEVMRFSTSG